MSADQLNRSNRNFDHKLKDEAVVSNMNVNTVDSHSHVSGTRVADSAPNIISKDLSHANLNISSKSYQPMSTVTIPPSPGHAQRVATNHLSSLSTGFAENKINLREIPNDDSLNPSVASSLPPQTHLKSAYAHGSAMDTSNHTHLPSERNHDCAFDIDDWVTVTCFNDPVVGQVRWIGKIPGETFRRTAIKLIEPIYEYLLDLCNGIYRNKYILCSAGAQNNILVARVDDCWPSRTLSTGEDRGKIYKDVDVSITRLDNHSISSTQTILKPNHPPATNIEDTEPKTADGEEFYPKCTPKESAVKIGSAVVLPHHDNISGVVRWIGLFESYTYYWVAVELDDYNQRFKRECTNGTFGLKKLCFSTKDNVLVTTLKKVKLTEYATAPSPEDPEKITKDIEFPPVHHVNISALSTDDQKVDYKSDQPCSMGAAADRSPFYPSEIPKNSSVEIESFVILPKHHDVTGVVRWIGQLRLDDRPDMYRAAVELDFVDEDLETFCTYGIYGGQLLYSSSQRNMFVLPLSDVKLYELSMDGHSYQGEAGNEWSPSNSSIEGGSSKVNLSRKPLPRDDCYESYIPSNSPCLVGDRVYISKFKLYGTVTWIGKLPHGPKYYRAAIKLDDPLTSYWKRQCSYGTFASKKLCHSSKKNIYITYLYDCQQIVDDDDTALLNVGDCVIVKDYDNVIGKIRWIGFLRSDPNTLRVALELSASVMKTFRWASHCTFGVWNDQKLFHTKKKNALVVAEWRCQLLKEGAAQQKLPSKGKLQRTNSNKDHGTPHEILIEPKVPEGLTFDIGDVVTTAMYPEAVGTVRWIGFIPSLGTCAAVESFDDDAYSKDDCTYGTYQGFRFYHGDKQNILVERVENCQPLVARQPYPKEKENPDIVIGEIKPILPETEVLGIRKGIQGEHNSCYMDASLFSMFAFNSFFDAWMLSGGVNEKHSEKRGLYRDIQRTLQTIIVNPLRQNGYVKSVAIQNLRKLLDEVGVVGGLKNEEKDPEELMNLLLNDVFNVKPFMKLNNEQEMHTFHLMADGDRKIPFPNIRKLLEFTFNQEKLTLAQVPDCMILHLPRFGKEMKLYENVFPNEELDISDLLQTARKCYLCAKKAAKECEECFKEGKNPQIQEGTFCEACDIMMHQRLERARHHRRRIENTSGVEIGVTSSRVKLILSAVLCIERSHYVAYVRTKINGPFKWVFFDSMSDREGDQNIPKVEEVPDLNLSEDNYMKLKRNGVGSLSPLPKRLFKDAYICIYINPETGQFR